VQHGLLLIDNAGTPLVVLMRGPDEHGPQENVTLEAVSPNAETARTFLHDVRRLMVELNVFRGQVISFGQSHMGHFGLGPVIFHHRPRLERDGLVLAAGLLESIEREMFGIARHKELLRKSGQHVKRGLLLYGSPDNGKTLTVKYLISELRAHTVVLLTGAGLHMLRPACGLARQLQPAVVVLEDVDLIAEERSMSPTGNPVLFELLNELDGMAEDADVAFLLTTNRADLLEPALTARPGRIDLAVEIGLPDDVARRRLIELYGKGLDVSVGDVDHVVERTQGVAASFIKELIRKSALLAADSHPKADRIRVKDADIQEALDDLLATRSAMTRVLLGGARDDAAT
jgi:cell division protease FtsH